MAGMNPPIERTAPQRFGAAALRAPRLVMSWEDWLTFVAAVFTFMSVAVSLQEAHWINNMPPFAPTAVAGLLVGMIAARVRYYALAIHPIAIIIGVVVVVLAAQSYADGATLSERLSDFRIRMQEWYDVVRAGDISNDNLPFVTLVHSLTFLATYFAAWSLFRWHNAWLAVVPSGVILLTNISFLPGKPTSAFVVFLFGSIVLIARMHLQKSQAEWRRDGVDYPEWISVSAIQLTVAATVGMIVAAWLLPLGNQANAVEGVFNTLAKPVTGQSDTLVRLFHNIDSRKGAHLHTFGDTLPIQGQVKLGTRQLFELNSAEPGLIRASSYDDYTGAGWKATGRDSNRVEARSLAPDENIQEAYQAREVGILRVKVLDPESVLLTPGTPLGSNLDTTIQTPKGFTGDIEEMQSRRALDKEDTYTSLGSQSNATVEQLLGDTGAYPDWVTKRYLQLPKELPQRVRDETARIIADGQAKSPYEKAKAIETYLRALPYDLNVPSPPPGRDAVDYLLFELRRGYFDYQSTAMCVMLRTSGIPCRVTVGYVLDASQADQTTYIVRKDSAYSWVEVYFPTYGWINFNPTADRPAGGASGLGSIDFVPSTTGPEPDLSKLFEDPIAGGIDPTTPQGALAETPIDHHGTPWGLIFSIAGVLAVLAVIAGSTRMAWNWGLGSLDDRAKMWAKTQRLAGWVHLGSRAAETPREWSRRMGKAVDREPEAVQLSDAFEEARYGRPDLQRIDDADANASYKSLRGALFAKLTRRKTKKKD
jgi:hypothetical protein